MTTVLKRDAYKILKDEVDKRGIKRVYLANKIGISPNYLGSVLNGSKNLSTDVAIKASQVLGISFDVFLRKS